MPGSALILNASRPDPVGQLHVDEHAGVVGLGRDFHKAPFNAEPVIAVILFGAQIPSRRAGAMNHAVRHAPGQRRVGIGPQAKCPAGEIPAVEQFEMIRRGDGILRAGGPDKRKRETEQNGGGFHGCKHPDASAGSQARGRSAPAYFAAVPWRKLMPPLTVLALTCAPPLPSVPLRLRPTGNSFFTTSAANSLFRLPLRVLAETSALAFVGKVASRWPLTAFNDTD